MMQVRNTVTLGQIHGKMAIYSTSRSTYRHIYNTSTHRLSPVKDSSVQSVLPGENQSTNVNSLKSPFRLSSSPSIHINRYRRDEKPMIRSHELSAPLNRGQRNGYMTISNHRPTSTSHRIIELNQTKNKLFHTSAKYRFIGINHNEAKSLSIIPKTLHHTQCQSFSTSKPAKQSPFRGNSNHPSNKKGLTIFFLYLIDRE